MRTPFREGETRPAGYVFDVPAKARHLADQKPSRPFLLLLRCGEGDPATLALMTTKATEAQYGATLFEFTGELGKRKLPGQERSYANLSSLHFMPTDELVAAEDNLARYLPRLRGSLKTALGVGSGRGRDGAGGSIRGYVVRLSERMVHRYAFEYGVVVTAHAYSAARRLQSVVPVIDAANFLEAGETVADFRGEDTDVIPPAGAKWLRQLPPDLVLPVIDTALVTSFSEGWNRSPRQDTWLEEQIVRVFPTPVDAETLAHIDAALSARLRLP